MIIIISRTSRRSTTSSNQWKTENKIKGKITEPEGPSVATEETTEELIIFDRNIFET
jgi:hypothetical protein